MYYAYLDGGGMKQFDFNTRSIVHVQRTIVGYNGALTKFEAFKKHVAPEWHLYKNDIEINVLDVITADNYEQILSQLN